ncbi:MAG TPA: CBS domain-containing protein [Steroidobacteraceae bacterium]|nr:CBS domain-containing protein [Steroidobacteraceae bacterium]
MVIGEICTSEVVCCRPQTSALDAAKLMRQKHVGDVVVVSDPEQERIPLGIVTDRDLTIEVLGCGREASGVPMSALVRTPVVIAKDSEDVRAVVGRMRSHGVRRIPVVDDQGVLVGIVSFDDVLQALLSDMQTLVESEIKAHRREQLVRR